MVKSPRRAAPNRSCQRGTAANRRSQASPSPETLVSHAASRPHRSAPPTARRTPAAPRSSRSRRRQKRAAIRNSPSPFARSITRGQGIFLMREPCTRSSRFVLGARGVMADPDLATFVLVPKGHSFEDFQEGGVFEHHWGRTLNAGDNSLFTTTTLA